MAIKHCNKKWKSRFCGECGAEIHGNSPVSELMEYLEAQIKSWQNRVEAQGTDEQKAKAHAKIQAEVGKRTAWIAAVSQGDNALRKLQEIKQDPTLLAMIQGHIKGETSVKSAE